MCVFVCLFVYFVWTLRNVLYTHNSIDDNMVWPQVLPIYPNWILVYIRWGDTYGFNWLLHHLGSSMWSFFNTNRLSLSFKTCLCHPKHLYSVVRYLQRTTVSISWNGVSLWAFHISDENSLKHIENARIENFLTWVRSIIDVSQQLLTDPNLMVSVWHAWHILIYGNFQFRKFIRISIFQIYFSFAIIVYSSRYYLSQNAKHDVFSRTCNSLLYHEKVRSFFHFIFFLSLL